MCSSDLLRGAVVIVGYNLQSSPEVGETGIDVFETPYTLKTRRLTSGPEIHATIYDNLLHGLSIAAPPSWLGYIMLVIGALAGLFASRPANLWSRTIWGLGLIAGTILLCWLTLRFGRLWMSPAEPVLAIILTITAIGTRDFAEIGRAHV